MEEAQRQHYATGEKPGLFTSFSYQAESWTRLRRIIAKAEYARLGSNQRFVVTNLNRNPASFEVMAAFPYAPPPGVSPSSVTLKMATPCLS